MREVFAPFDFGFEVVGPHVTRMAIGWKPHIAFCPNANQMHVSHNGRTPNLGGRYIF